MHKSAIKIVWGGLGSQKLCAFYHKCGAFGGKINCAPFGALFGSIMCAFEFRIIRHSAGPVNSYCEFPLILPDINSAV